MDRFVWQEVAKTAADIRLLCQLKDCGVVKLDRDGRWTPHFFVSNKPLLPDADAEGGVMRDPRATGWFYRLIPVTFEDEVRAWVIGHGTASALHRETTRARMQKLALQAWFLTLLDELKVSAAAKWNEPLSLMACDQPVIDTLKQLKRFAHSRLPIFLTGESGVGKEVFSKTCFLLGMDLEAPFYSFNCAQFFDDTLTISELFGHKKGSFTGAAEDRKGIFDIADGGMVFLDEIGELSMQVQKMLLRFIDQHEIKPLGSSHPHKIDVRIVSATNRNMEEMVEAGKFREDLFYRLNSLHIKIPPLRDRGRDINLLLRFYLDQLNHKYDFSKRFSREALTALNGYTFPGNVRELKNIVETGFWSSGPTTIEWDHIRGKLRKETAAKSEIGKLRGVARLMGNMFEEGLSYWSVVKEPFMNRDIKRSEVKAIIRRGLERSGGSYKKMLPLFNIPDRDYKKFVDHLRLYDLRP
ncbi:MAG: sigma 54-interacting transcriptional regulator [Acidobacteriota bacterium]|nr:sigma 54-interacting transcriptional regulator [Acidobacteriota bacterium]